MYMEQDIRKRFQGVCECCGKPTYAQYRSTLKRFCSHKCSNQWKWDNLYEHRKSHSVNCAYCGKEFSIWESDWRNKIGQEKFYCSRACAGLARKLNNICPICGNIIENPHNKTCSMECGVKLRKMEWESHLTEEQKKEKERLKNRRIAWMAKYYKENPIRKFADATRKNVAQSFKRRDKYPKNEHTEEILGCSMQFFCEYIESKFKDGMTMENYGEWQLDHIIPLATAKTKEEIIKLCHYTNYQPLWKKENLSKKDKIPDSRL